MGYLIVAQLSGIIRMFIENPLESLIKFDNFNIEGFAELIFVFQYWPMIIHVLTFGIVGGIYKKGEFPALGSALYLLTFWINSNILKFLVLLLGTYGLVTVIVPFLVICLLEFIGMHKLRINIIDEILV